MDELELFTTLRPRPGTDLTGQRERARVRLASAMSESGARAGTRRFGALNSPTRTAFAAGGAALAVGGAVVLSVVLPTVLSSGQPGSLVTSAWAVQASKDGTVKVTIKDASDPAGLQRALRAAGVRAIVVSPPEISFKDARGGWVTHPSCAYPTTGRLFAPAAVQRAVITFPKPTRGPVHSSEVIAFIHPSAMPAGSVLFISDTFSALPDGVRSLSVTSPAVLKSSKLPRCRPNAPRPVPSPSQAPVPSASARPAPTSSQAPVPVPSGSASPAPTSSQAPVPTPRPTRTTRPTPVPTPAPSGSPGHSPAPTPIPSRGGSPAPTPTPS